MSVRCLFRAVKKGGDRGTVECILFDNPANRGFLCIYAHVGQHCEGTRGYYREYTSAARPEEYAPLKRELEQIYQDELVVYQRLPKDFHAWDPPA